MYLYMTRLKDIQHLNIFEDCVDDDNDTGGISIWNIGGVFIVIFAGIFLALVTLCVEYAYYRHQNPDKVAALANTRVKPAEAGKF